MPLPLIPFAIKGAFVLGKYMMAKGAAAKVAAATVQTVKAVGVANTLAGAATALVVVGGVKWTAENFDRATRAYRAANNGDLAGAARALIGIASSVHGTASNTLGGDLSDWAQDGYPVDGRIIGLARDAYDTAMDAKPD
ncbi:hypothetical protein [Sphingomonas sp. LT1P40]|uniref:hypothetical protein n=1 Tax=Alteristakelama amylovorans TaxID=3096166 RepID=UPI002FCB72F2